MDTPSKKDIEYQLDLADDLCDEGGTKVRGMTYEQGVRDALRWVTEGGDGPLDDPVFER